MSGLITIVTEVAGDFDSDSSITDYNYDEKDGEDGNVKEGDVDDNHNNADKIFDKNAINGHCKISPP